MAYEKPSLSIVGIAASVILGSTQNGDPDNGIDGNQLKQVDIPAGLDE